MKISEVLIKKYLEIKRDLPWRNTQDPYYIWLSEVILQQTRVNQGLPYFTKFSQIFPDLQSLAQASEDQILHLWQGLGYYSRARNMLKTAQIAFQTYGNTFPSSYNELIQLKGIGPYTAAAVASFSANEPFAVVDGNVIRVIARFVGITEPVNSTTTKKEISRLAQEWMDPKHAGLHNQAIMELGALICKPQNPLCDECPLIGACYAYSHNAQKEIPAKTPKKTKKIRYLHYFLVNDEKQYIRKRNTDDIWAGLYELPLIESNSAELTVLQSENPILHSKHTHQLSHQTLKISFWELQDLPFNKNDYLTVANEDLAQYGFPIVLHKTLSQKFKL